MRFKTCSYKSINILEKYSFVPISIEANPPKSYTGVTLPELAPPTLPYKRFTERDHKQKSVPDALYQAAGSLQRYVKPDFETSILWRQNLPGIFRRLQRIEP